MKVTTLRLPESLYEEIQAESEARKESVSEYLRKVIRDHERPQANSETDLEVDLADRVDALEDRLEDLETAVEGRGTVANGAQQFTGRDEVKTGVRDWIDDHMPEDKGLKLSVYTAWQAVRHSSTLSADSLKDRLDTECSPHFDRDTMWETVTHHFEDVPGIERDESGQWVYAGDDKVRTALQNP